MLKGTRQPFCGKGHENPVRDKFGRCILCYTEYQRVYTAEWRKKNINIVRIRERRKSDKRRERNRERAFQYLGNKCKDCGNDDRRVLEFDHLRDKISTIAKLLGRKWEVVQEELEKCELVCGNCHNIRTYERRKECQQ